MTHRALVAALIEAARWLDLPEHRNEAARLMIDNGWVQAPADTIRASLQPHADGLVFHRHAATFPWRSHAIWFALQMLRWLEHQPAGPGMVDRALLRAANLASK